MYPYKGETRVELRHESSRFLTAMDGSVWRMHVGADGHGVFYQFRAAPVDDRWSSAQFKAEVMALGGMAAYMAANPAVVEPRPAAPPVDGPDSFKIWGAL